MHALSEVPVFILCGGLGTRIREETEFRPKPMVPLGTRPMLWHIMRLYSRFGFRRFILCLGYKGEVIKSYFLHYEMMHRDFTVSLATGAIHTYAKEGEEDWEVTLVDTGEGAMTGARLAKAAEKYLGEARVAAVTYGDGLTDVNLRDEFLFHERHGKMGTVLGVNPPSRFGEIRMEGERVCEFEEKPTFGERWINGGFFFFKREFFQEYLNKYDSCVLEKQPLIKLARDNELSMYKHTGFWACMDTQRDRDYLNQLYLSGKAPWAHSSYFVHSLEAHALQKNPAGGEFSHRS